MDIELKPLNWEKGTNYTYADFCGIRYHVVKSGVSLPGLGQIGDPSKNYYTVVKRLSGYSAGEYGSRRTIHTSLDEARIHCQEEVKEDIKIWFNILK